MNPNRPTARYIIKIAKIKERFLKAAREKQRVAYKGIPMKLSVDLSSKALWDRMEWHDIFNM